jgi:hypothetical protein
MSVKGIAVFTGQVVGAQRAGGIDVQQRVAGNLHRLDVLKFQPLRLGQPPKPHFRRDLPGRCCRNKQNIALVLTGSTAINRATGVLLRPEVMVTTPVSEPL